MDRIFMVKYRRGGTSSLRPFLYIVRHDPHGNQWQSLEWSLSGEKTDSDRNMKESHVKGTERSKWKKAKTQSDW